jgi:peptidoglycan hydrolase-like protein with peptidoglycan-binding domain
MARNVTEIQARLIDLGFLTPLNDSGLSNADGKFGTTTLGAYNRFRASKGEPPHTGLLLLVEVSADVFPEDTPPPAPKASNPITDYLSGLAIKAALNAVKGTLMFAFLDGYKTIIVGVVAIVTGLISMLGWTVHGLPVLGAAEGWQLVLTGLGLLGLRRAITTSAAK